MRPGSRVQCLESWGWGSERHHAAIAESPIKAEEGKGVKGAESSSASESDLPVTSVGMVLLLLWRGKLTVVASYNLHPQSLAALVSHLVGVCCSLQACRQSWVSARGGQTLGTRRRASCLGMASHRMTTTTASLSSRSTTAFNSRICGVCARFQHAI